MNFTEPKIDGFERVVRFADDDFSAYIALHNTRLGPALGGCRIMKYYDDADLLQDALNLSSSMSYKNSLAGLDFGGGKCVVNATRATPDIMHKVGQAVEYLKGSYIAAEDVGTTVADMQIAAEETSHIGSLGAAGDPSPWTALGVYSCIRTIIEHFEDPNPRVWIEGLGKVGWALAEHLHGYGAKLLVSDIIDEKVDLACDKFKAVPYFAQDRLCQPVDVYAPCSLGPVVETARIGLLPPVICGCANNQLIDDRQAELLYWANVTYCPDFLVNAGGVIAVSSEITGFDKERVTEKVVGLGKVLAMVLGEASKEHKPPLTVAKDMAERRWK